MNPTNKRMHSFPIWIPGDRSKDIGRKSRECVSEQWGKCIRECEVVVWGRDRDDGTGFSIRAYMGSRDKVPSLAARLLDLVDRLNTKIYGFSLRFHDRLLSQDEKCVDDMRTVERIYDEQQRVLEENVRRDDRVKEALSKGATDILVYAQTNLSCELSDANVNKVVVETIGDYLERTQQYLQTLVRELQNAELAKGVVGYRLWRDLDKLKIDDIDASDKDVVVVWLAYPAE